MFRKKSGKPIQPVEPLVLSEGDSTTKGSQGEEVTTPQNATDLIGGSGVSLDGRSLVVPMDRDFDEVSSINTAQYGFVDGMRVLGKVEHGKDIENVEERQSTAKISQNNEAENQYYDVHPAQSKADEKTLSTAGSDAGCLPLWITDAPRWLKVLIVFSTALLVGAVVLVGAGAWLAIEEDRETSAAIPSAPTFPSFPTQPVASPSSEVSPTVTSPSMAPVAATPMPFSSPSVDPLGGSPTIVSSFSPTSSTVSVFVTGGRFLGEALDALPGQLKNLPDFDSDAVMFHLGDWNSPFATSCNEESYITNTNLYKDSSVPVYFVPGDNEYNDCPDPDQALSFWREYLVGFETQYWDEPTWNITRQDPDYAENFAYVNNGVLFIGVNLVGGTVHDSREWQERHAANLEWIDDQFLINEGDFDVMVVLAHGDPVVLANEGFYRTFYARVEDNYNVQVILVNRNLQGENWGLEARFNGIANLMRVVAEGSVWPPLLMQIDTKAGTVDIDQSQWFQSNSMTP